VQCARTLTQSNHFPRVNRCSPSILDRVCFTHFSGRVLHRRAFYAFFRACSAPTVRFTFFSGHVLHWRSVLYQRAFYTFFRACFAPTVCCILSGRVLHQRGILNQHAFYAFFRACFAQAGRFADLPEFFLLSARFTAFAGVFHTAGVFQGTGCSARGRVTLRRRAHPAGVLRIPGAFGADGNGVFLFFGVLNACDLWSVSRRRCVFYLSPRGCYSFGTPVFNKTHPPRLCFLTRKVS
jgi:hypothetical protein